MKQLPVDELLRTQFLPRVGGTAHLLKPHLFAPFRHMVTLALVRDPAISSLAHQYIMTLLSEKARYGYLFHLAEQTLAVPLDLRFNGSVALDPKDYADIVSELDKKAAAFFPFSQRLPFEITRVELLYFYVALANPHLNWIAIDHLLRNNRRHAYLMTDLAKSMHP